MTAAGCHGVLLSERRSARSTKGASTLKNIERALIATGVALVISGGAASAAILWNTTADAAQPFVGTQLAAQIGTGVDPLSDKGGRGGADRITAAAAYIGIPAADLKTQLASGKSLADIAVANGKTRDGLIAALVAAEQQAISAFVDQKGLVHVGGPGPGGRVVHFEFGVQGDPLAAAATFLGVTTADLSTKLQSGQTLAQVATASGKTRDALIQAIVAEAKAKIAQAKTDGKLTADQATSLENGLTEHVAELVDSTHLGPREPHR
jgi:hypothetical protein